MSQHTSWSRWPQALRTPPIGRSGAGQIVTAFRKKAGLLHEWPAAGPTLIWQLTDVGSGYSTPSVAGGRIYLLGNQGMDDEFVQARNEQDGKSRLVDAYRQSWQPRPTTAISWRTIDTDS